MTGERGRTRAHRRSSWCPAPRPSAAAVGVAHLAGDRAADRHQSYDHDDECEHDSPGRAGRARDDHGDDRGEHGDGGYEEKRRRADVFDAMLVVGVSRSHWGLRSASSLVGDEPSAHQAETPSAADRYGATTVRRARGRTLESRRWALGADAAAGLTVDT